MNINGGWIVTNSINFIPGSDGENIGDGSGIFQDVNNNTLRFKTIVPVSGLEIIDTGTELEFTILSTVGEAGPSGATGPQGPSGVAGPSGATGLTGATGPQGPSGVAGPSGATGPSGSQGVQGEIGPSGTAHTFSNIGAGEGVFSSIVSDDVQFKSIVGNSGIDVSSDSDEIFIDFDITEVTELGPTVSGLYYRKDEDVIPDIDETYTIGNQTTKFVTVHASTGVFTGANNEVGKVAVGDFGGGLECAIIERGLPGAFPALVMRGGRAAIMETSNLGTMVSGFYMGPTQNIIMGDIEDYTSKTGGQLYSSELNHFDKKITSVLHTKLVDSSSNRVAHYVFNTNSVNSKNSNPSIALEAVSQTNVTKAVSNYITAIKARAVALDSSSSVVIPNGLYAGLDCQVIHSGVGRVSTAKAAYFGLSASSTGSFGNAYVVHIAAPSGSFSGANKSLWCEGEACFTNNVEIVNDLNIGSDIIVVGTVEGDIFQVNDSLTVESISTFNDDITATADAFFDNDASVSGCLETKIRRDASRRESFVFVDNIAFDRNLIYGDMAAAGSILTVTDPGKNGQETKVVWKQNNAGTGFVTFSYSGGIKWRGGAAPTLTATSGVRDIFTFLYDSTDDVLYGHADQGYA